MTWLTVIAAGGPASAREVTFGERLRPPTEDDAAPPPGAALDRIGQLVERATVAVAAPEPSATRTGLLLGLAFTVDDALRGPDFGRWHGLSIEAVAAGEPEAFARWTRDPHAVPPGGESLADLVDRVRDEVLTPVSQAAGPGGGRRERRAAVASPLVVRALIAAVLHPERRGAAGDAVLRVDVEPWSVTTLTCHHGRWNLRLTA